MIKILLDTNIWLGIAEDHKQIPLLDTLITKVDRGEVALLVPKLVVDEFTRCRPKVAARARERLHGPLNQVTRAIREAGIADEVTHDVLKYLSVFRQRHELVGRATHVVLARIALLLNNATKLEASPGIKQRAADRALLGLAPCHHANKNAITDAVLVETYFDCLRRKKSGDHHAFVTGNTHDFSAVGADERTPHPDLVRGLTNRKSRYFVTLAECLQWIDPDCTERDLTKYGRVSGSTSLPKIRAEME